MAESNFLHHGTHLIWTEPLLPSKFLASISFTFLTLFLTEIFPGSPKVYPEVRLRSHPLRSPLSLATLPSIFLHPLDTYLFLQLSPCSLPFPSFILAHLYAPITICLFGSVAILCDRSCTDPKSLPSPHVFPSVDFSLTHMFFFLFLFMHSFVFPMSTLRVDSQEFVFSLVCLIYLATDDTNVSAWAGPCYISSLIPHLCIACTVSKTGHCYVVSLERQLVTATLYPWSTFPSRRPIDRNQSPLALSKLVPDKFGV